LSASPNSNDDPTARIALSLLAAGRIAIGAGIWLAPRPALRALGFGDPGPAALTLARIAGTRDLVIGTRQAAARDRDEARAATLAAAVSDAGDTVAFAFAIAAGDRLAGIRGIAAALPATAAGLWLARRLRG
jgi:hypothetical protein